VVLDAYKQICTYYAHQLEIAYKAEGHSRVKKVTVITGGAGGMGLATAKVVGKEQHVVICDINPQRLESAIADLKQLGIECDSVTCDITDPQSVQELIQKASELGALASVIHTAGISPQMADPTTILKVNALGTVNILNACLEVANEGFALVNVASMAGHLIPKLMLPVGVYPLAMSDTSAFLKRAQRLSRFMPTKVYRNGFAYGISKHFVIWISKKYAGQFGDKCVRLLSVSPGTFDTEMGHLEEKSGSAEMLKKAALKRFGKPEEIAELLAFCASDKASYLTGTDILCDGGVVAART
jgi:NAD(P)-dependent dehydrogenase (short-subunit alcohol dehydrogenase family)